MNLIHQAFICSFRDLTSDSGTSDEMFFWQQVLSILSLYYTLLFSYIVYSRTLV